MKDKIWLIGTGYMAIEYLKVLRYLGKKVEVIGRGKHNAKKFLKLTGYSPYIGGLEKAINESKPANNAIVSVTVDELYKCTKLLIENGCKRVLLEKPGSLKKEDLIDLKILSKKYNSEIFIAYNRRFYKSVITLLTKVKEAGPITSVNFEFTEFGYQLKKDTVSSKETKEKWLLANSSHVLDTVFSIIGWPKKKLWSAFISGESEWHPSGMQFNGAGISQKGIPFSYFANWDSPGRWGIELCTSNKKYLLRPMEELYEMNLGEFQYKKIDFIASDEDKFKPGLLLQCKAFLEEKKSFLSICTLEEQILAFNIYNKIAGY